MRKKTSRRSTTLHFQRTCYPRCLDLITRCETFVIIIRFDLAAICRFLWQHQHAGICCFTNFLCQLILYLLPKKTEKRIRNSANRVCNAMTNNPIYDGPVYDSIHPQFDTLRNTKTVTPPLDLSLPLSFATNHEQQTDLDSRDSSPTSDRYVKQQTTHSTSHQFQDLGISSTSSNLCTFTTATSAPNPAVAASNPCNVDVAMSERSHLARQRDEELEEKHKLQLSFDLDLHEDQGFPAHQPAEIEDMFSQKFDEILELCSSASASLTPLESTGDDEKYTIMSPVRPLTEGSLNLRGRSNVCVCVCVSVCVCMCVRACMCVCVCEKERERE